MFNFCILSIRKRRNAKLQAISEKLRYRREEPIVKQGAWLRRVLAGYYRYHAVHGNLRVLGATAQTSHSDDMQVGDGEVTRES